jgi:hypothetical protein
MISTFQSGPKIVDDGLILHLDAGNYESYPGSGTTWFDLTRYQNDGVLVNNPTYNISNLGNITTDFNNQSYISLPLNDIWNFGIKSFSVGAWFKTTETTDYKLGNLFVYDNAVSNGFWGIGSQTNAINFAIYDTDRVRSVISTAVTTINDGKWHYVVGVRDISTTSVKIYFDGDLYDSETESPILDITGSPTTYPAIGRRGSWNTVHPTIPNYSNYTVSIAHVYSRALSQTEVIQNYNTLKSRFGYY